jgi:hypothetical protein
MLVADGQPVVGRDKIRVTFPSLARRELQLRLTTFVKGMAEDLALAHAEGIVRRIEETASEYSRLEVSAGVVGKQPDVSWRFINDNPYTLERSAGS